MFKKFAIIGSSLGALLIAPVAFAAADADVINAATTTATTMKENIVGAIIPSLPLVIAAGILILAVMVVWRLGKRFVGGR